MTRRNYTDAALNALATLIVIAACTIVAVLWLALLIAIAKEIARSV